MRRLMQGSGVRRSRGGMRDSKVIARLEEFAAACAQARPSLQPFWRLKRPAVS